MNAHSSQPRASLARVLDELGATLLEPVYRPSRPRERIGGVVIYDPVDDLVVPSQALVLGVGLSDPEQIASLVTRLGQHDATALIVRAPLRRDDTIEAAVERSGVAVLALARGATWTQLAAMLRSLLAEGDLGSAEQEHLGGIVAGDLFALANAVAALLDAPVTIEDRNSRVLAFSGRQEEADPSRIDTVLGRQVPAPIWQALNKHGVFSQIYGTDEPVFVPAEITAFGGSEIPRVAIAVRAGDEVLGSVWAAVREPLSPQRHEAFRDIAKLVALHMLRVRAGADVERRLRADLLGTALEGGPKAAEALNRLGLNNQPLIVLALALKDPSDLQSAGLDTTRTTHRQWMADAFSVHLAATYPRSAVALIAGVAYGLIPGGQDTAAGERHAVQVAADFLKRIGVRVPAVIGISSVGSGAGDIPHARGAADRVVRVLQQGTDPRGVATPADVQVASLLLEMRDLVALRCEPLTGAIARLAAYDAQHNANLVETLRSWLDAFGDIAVASAAAYVHPNTFRYRLRRVSEVGGIDLTDPEDRFAAMLQLRVIAPAP